ncbi:1e746d0e-cad4-45bb-98d2-434188b0484f [Thermothielavioides terrestris]|uniref:SUR7 protein n=2 Tax=Thermothielavioides terrestris TaxID=2587410 RepID=G2R4S1_THETT|nr:uncharacterized protein THITE_2113952 [Thermothielavioides terrestris NRRL 8126]AEO66111.1 hypothetical protein THITE_2113952 [Thermothielavioides terrestris NRRL 8126]SPQ18630.1 1e746d0e-cad4-45bb-98d2-434188b0484f [Thermothielavioides terrestris]
MANFGRFVCVLLPFLLTLASLIAMLLAGLAGISDKGLFMFEINTTNLSISPDQVSHILDGSGFNLNIPKVSDINIGKRQAQQTNNITSKDLGLYNIYDVNIWNYCYTAQNGTRDCTKPAFNWAESALNSTTDNFHSLITPTGVNVTLPKEMSDAIKSFATVSKWTQIVFVIAYIALGVELFFGLFASCSRIFSCLTWVIALVTGVIAGAAAGLATATSVIVVGALEASGKPYGLSSHLNGRFLAVVWIGEAFAIAAALFWMFTICCCAPDHGSWRRSRSRGGPEAEKFMPGPSAGYERLSDPHGSYSGAGYARQSYGPASQHAGAYEPYSHTRV